MKLGKAFSDSVIVEDHKVMRPIDEEARSWWLGMGRLLMFVTILAVAFFILLWRLFDLTIVQGHHFRVLADGNRTRELIRHAPRGLLLDRTGKPLVADIPYYRRLTPCSKASDDCVTPVSREEGDRLVTLGLPPGNFLEVDYRRQYLYSQSLSHMLGYTGELTAKELGDDYYKLRGYGRGDRVGRTGAEAVFEDRLRGRDGKELVEVDAHSRIVRTLGRDHEIAGENITLSLDLDLQRAVADAFPKGEKGAIIVTKPSTGEILALYSSPTFDANEFSYGLSQQEYEHFVTNPEQPLFDRAIGGVYPPGSTFKLVIATAALEDKALTRDTMVNDTGVLTIGPFSFPNWYFSQYGKTEGLVNIVKAIQRSNDIFFYKAGEYLGITRLAAWAKKIGIGKPLGIELGGEASGLMPDPAWKKNHFDTPQDRELHNDDWYLGDTYHVSIGQGYLLVTPLQVNSWTNLIANDGVLCRPTINKVFGGLGPRADCKDLAVKKETIDLISEGMYRACQTGGTGWPLFNFSVKRQEFSDKQEASPSSTLTRVPIACKTGTAEFGDPKNRTHAWFTSYAPVPKGDIPPNDISQGSVKAITGDPEISVTVLVEGAGEGSYVAAPVAKKIYEEWFGR